MHQPYQPNSITWKEHKRDLVQPYQLYQLNSILYNGCNSAASASTWFQNCPLFNCIYFISLILPSSADHDGKPLFVTVAIPHQLLWLEWSQRLHLFSIGSNRLVGRHTAIGTHVDGKRVEGEQKVSTGDCYDRTINETRKTLVAQFKYQYECLHQKLATTTTTTTSKEQVD